MMNLRGYGAREAFTLIELLIVVAIIAIITGGSMAILTGPMFERVRAEDQEAFEAGAGVFFASLVHDAHRAASMEAESTGTITLTFAAPAPGKAVYAINEQGTLTRAVDGTPGAKLVPEVESLKAEKLSTGSLWTVSLSASLRGYDGKSTTVTRRMDVLAGANAWAGGAS